MPSPSVIESFKDAIGGAEDRNLFESLEAGKDFCSEADDRRAGFARHHDVDQLVIGRILSLAPLLQAMVEELEVLVFLGEDDGGSGGVKRLDDDFAGLDASPGAAGDLAQQLESTFAAAEVRQVERDVGGNDSN